MQLPVSCIVSLHSCQIPVIIAFQDKKRVFTAKWKKKTTIGAIVFYDGIKLSMRWRRCILLMLCIYHSHVQRSCSRVSSSDVLWPIRVAVISMQHVRQLDRVWRQMSGMWLNHPFMVPLVDPAYRPLQWACPYLPMAAYTLLPHPFYRIGIDHVTSLNSIQVLAAICLIQYEHAVPCRKPRSVIASTATDSTVYPNGSRVYGCTNVNASGSDVDGSDGHLGK